jgi:30S ribosomal protein 3
MEKFVLKFLWLDTTIAFSLSQKVGERVIPLTEYFFWPQTDSWSTMKIFLENENGWITENESSLLLNRVTEIINFWQNKETHEEKDLNAIRNKFSDCLFIGHL